MMKNSKPFISVILPAFNEEAIIEINIEKITNYLKSKEYKYRWEILIIDDGSSDKTGEIADSLVKTFKNFRVIHHSVNLNLGRALQTGFRNVQGDIIVVLDMDLSYSVDHIERLVDTQIMTNADIVIASPYMKNGKVTNVPFIRELLSRSVNRFMRFAAQEKFYTYTSMVRAYKTEFIITLNLKSKDYDINPEILYKAMILRSQIIEIPAHLDWSEQNHLGAKRKSSMRVVRTFFSGLMAGFIFRPYIFFLSIGIILFIIAFYLVGWIFYFIFTAIPQIPTDSQAFDGRFSLALKQIYNQRPILFFAGGLTLLASFQILSLGFLSVQKKRYFEELFHINTSILRQSSKQGLQK